MMMMMMAAAPHRAQTEAGKKASSEEKSQKSNLVTAFSFVDFFLLSHCKQDKFWQKMSFVKTSYLFTCDEYDGEW